MPLSARPKRTVIHITYFQADDWHHFLFSPKPGARGKLIGKVALPVSFTPIEKKNSVFLPSSFGNLSYVREYDSEYHAHVLKTSLHFPLGDPDFPSGFEKLNKTGVAALLELRAVDFLIKTFNANHLFSLTLTNSPSRLKQLEKFGVLSQGETTSSKPFTLGEYRKILFEAIKRTNVEKGKESFWRS